VDRFEEREKRFLNEVFRHLSVIDFPKRECGQTSFESIHKLSPTFRVATADLLQQVVFRFAQMRFVFPLMR